MADTSTEKPKRNGNLERTRAQCSRDLDIWAAVALSFESFVATECTVPKSREVSGIDEEMADLVEQHLAEVYRLRAEGGTKKSWSKLSDDIKDAKLRSAIIDALARAWITDQKKFDKVGSKFDSGRRQIVNRHGDIAEEYETFLEVSRWLDAFDNQNIRRVVLKVRPRKGRWSGLGSDRKSWIKARLYNRNRAKVDRFLNWWSSQL